jgi:hypothetical protein
MDRIPVFDVKKFYSLAKYLRLVIGFYCQTLERVQIPQSALQFAVDGLVHLFDFCPV